MLVRFPLGVETSQNIVNDLVTMVELDAQLLELFC